MESNNVITYGNIKLVSPYEVKSLIGLKITKEINNHSKIYFKGIIEEDKKDEYISKASTKDKIELNYIENGATVKCLFKGVISKIKIKAVNSIYYVEAEGISNTYELDVKLKKRSFQNKNMSYTEFVQKVISNCSGADFINVAAQGKTIGRFLLQYNETDWQFLKRTASKNGDVLVADDSGDKPRFWFGVPQREINDIEDFHYTIKRNLSSFMITEENYCESLDESDFTTYEIESIKALNIGDKVSVKGKALVVSRVEAEITDGTLKYEYVVTTEKGIRQNLIQNENIIGAAIEGKVIGISKDTVRIHLEIDESQESEAYWFPYSSFYASEGGNGWYCMPQTGDSVKLYFPNGREEEATAISSVRKGGGSCAKTADPSIKYIGTNNGKELKMGGNDLSLTAKEGSVFIKLHEAEGIEIHSDKAIVFNSGGDIEIKPEKKMSISAKDAVYLMCGESSIVMDGKTDLKGSKVKMDGTKKSPVTVEEDPEDIADAEAEKKAAEEVGAIDGGDSEKAEAAEAEKPSAEDKNSDLLDAVQLGLDVLGMVPGPVGIIADVANAGISFARGDKKGAALSLLCCIPFAGPALKGSKIAKGAGKAAKLAGKAGKLAGKAAKGAKVAKKQQRL